MTQLFTNNAVSTLTGSILSSDLSMTINSGDSAKFASPTGGDFQLVTLVDVTGAIFEIVKVTARASNVLTIVRHQEGTSAAGWPSGTKVYAALTAASISPLNGGKQFDGLALSDTSSSLIMTSTAGYWLVPCNCTLNDLFIGVTAAQSSSGAITVDAKLSGTSIFSTLPIIAASQDTNLTGGTLAVLSTTSFTKGQIVVFSITGAGTGAKGLQTRMTYTPT